MLKSTSWMSAKFNWFRLPLSHEVTVGVGAAEEVLGVADDVVDEDALVVECDVVWGVDVVVGCCVALGVVDVVLGGGGGWVVEGGGGEPPPNTQLPYTWPASRPPGTRYWKRPGERSIAAYGHSSHCMGN